jgi:hypothetical protein
MCDYYAFVKPMYPALRGWMLWRAAAVPCACALHELPKVLLGCFEPCFEDSQKQKQAKTDQKAVFSVRESGEAR